MLSNCTSACGTSRLAYGNTQEQTHSETSSNCLCTNDELGNWSVEKGIEAIKTHAPNAKVEDHSET
jgi:hypothetical protein